MNIRDRNIFLVMLCIWRAIWKAAKTPFPLLGAAPAPTALYFDEQVRGVLSAGLTASFAVTY